MDSVSTREADMIIAVGEWFRLSSRVCAVVGRCLMTIKRRLDGVRERVLCGELALNKAGKLENLGWR